MKFRNINTLYIVFIAVTFFFLPNKKDQVFGKDSNIHMNITRSGRGKIALATPQFEFKSGRDQENFSSKSVEILMADLKASGYFKPIDNKEFLNELEDSDRKKRNIDFTEWRAIGAEGLIKGVITMENGTISIQFRLYDVQERKQIIGVKYSANRRKFREMIHRFSDEVVYKYIGEQGIAMTRIAFVSTSNGHKEIYMCDYDGKNLKKLTNDKSITLFPKWAPDAQTIVYTTYRYRNPDLYSLDVNTREINPISTEPGMNISASWSPDGEKLVLSLSKDGNPELYVMNKNGRILQRLTNRRSIETSPDWSPTGRSISYISDRSGKPQIYIMDVEGTNVRRLTYSGTFNEQPAWSPDGSKIAYTSKKNGHLEIYVLSIADSKETRLTRNAGNNQRPSWAPNGRKIIFSSNRNGSYQLYTMDVDGSNQKQLLYLEGGGYNPSWSKRYDKS